MRIPDYEVDYCFASDDDDADVVAINIFMEGVLIGCLKRANTFAGDLEEADAFLRLALWLIKREQAKGDVRATSARGKVIDITRILEAIP